MLCVETNLSRFAVMCWTPIHQEDVGNPFKNFHLVVWREKALVLRFLVRNSTCWVAVDGLKMLPMKFTAMILRGTLGVMLLHYQLQGNTPNCSTKSFCTVAIEVFSRFTWSSLSETTLYHAFMESLCILFFIGNSIGQLWVVTSVNIEKCWIFAFFLLYIHKIKTFIFLNLWGRILDSLLHPFCIFPYIITSRYFFFNFWGSELQNDPLMNWASSPLKVLC